MLKRVVLLLFCTFLYVSVYTESSNYVDYFKTVNQAELCIAKADYRSALAVYKDIFKQFPHSFEKEVYNACLCAMKGNQWKDVLKLSKDLVLLGYESKDFESPAFDEFRNNEKQWKKFLSEYPDLRAEYEKTIDKELRNKYLTLYKTDQQYAAGNIDIKTQDSVFYELALSVSNLIKEYGFPHWMINKDTINPHLQVMLRHYCGLENRIKADEKMQKDSFYVQMKNNDIRLLVTQALNEGWLDPERYVPIVSYWDATNPYGDVAIGLDFESEKVSSFLRVPPEKRDELNKKRDSIGLPIFNELTQDVINSTWYREYPFKKIKEAWLACDTCSNIDYMRIATELSLDIENQYEDSNNYFHYYSKRLSNDIYFLNTKKYQKNFKRQHATDNQ